MRVDAIILDRDGVLIKDGGYVHKTGDVEFYPRVIEALQLLHGIKIIIITNQAGIAKGIFREEDYIKLREYIHGKLKENGIIIAAEYFCPHHPDGIVAPYNMQCNCRKPMSGMFERAIKEHNLNPKNCWSVGDMRRDIIAGQNVGIKGILVKTGFGGEGGDGDAVVPEYVAEDLYDAIDFIMKQ